MVEYIVNNCHVSRKTSFEDFIAKNAQEIASELPSSVTIDIIYDDLIDLKSKDQALFVKQLDIHLNSYPHRKRFDLIYEAPFHYVTPTIYSSHVQAGYKVKGLQQLDSLTDLSRAEKGEFYEKFCTLFLEDMGLTAQKTKSSGDKGIDIIAFYPINLPNRIVNFFLDENIYLLAQAKFYSAPVDTPTIRKLVGDSLFVRFDRLEYLPIAHNAFHLSVFSHSGYTKLAKEFAKNNKVLLFTSEDIIDFVCNEQEPDELECTKYLWSFKKA